MSPESLFVRVWSSRRRLGLLLAICLSGPLWPSVSQAEAVYAAFEPAERGTIGGAIDHLHPPASAAQRTMVQDMGSRAMLSLERFSSERQAVEAAIARFNPYSVHEDREYLGAIIKLASPTGSRTYRYLVARGKPGQDRVSIQLPVPKGAELLAFWHTHGAPGPHRHLFSSSDTRLVKKTGKPFYMADANGDLRVYRPGQKLLSAGLRRQLGLPFGHGYAEGELLADS